MTWHAMSWDRRALLWLGLHVALWVCGVVAVWSLDVPGGGLWFLGATLHSLTLDLSWRARAEGARRIADARVRAVEIAAEKERLEASIEVIEIATRKAQQDRSVEVCN